MGVKAKVAAPKVKVGVKAPATKAKVKVGVKAPTVKAKVGGKAPAVKGKVGLKIGVKAPKVKVTAKPKAKISGGIHVKLPSIKLGASGSTKATVKTQAKVYTGTCPYATKFGMTAVKAYAHTNKSVCKSLESTCCDAKSMTDYQTGFRKWPKSLSKTMWTLLRIPTMAGVIMGNLKVDK